MYGKGKVSLLEDRTSSELGVMINGLRPGSHTKVFVRCSRCAEEFTREFRNLHQLHQCPAYRTIDNERRKWCNRCQNFKSPSLFSKNSARPDGLSSQCTGCIQNKGAPPARLARLCALRSTFDGWLKRLICQKKSTTAKDGIPFNLTTQYMADLWESQSGKCYYTRITLKHNSRSLSGAQIDRIIPSKGYVAGNVVWSSKGFNNLKNDATLDELTEYFSQINFSLPFRCEFMKLEPNARMPTRARATDAGLDVYALESNVLQPEQITIIRTGIALVVPPNYYYTIEGRSSLWKHGVVPCRGIIDATYSGELKVAIINHNSTNPYSIAAGDRIAQLIMHRFVPVDVVEVARIDDSYSERGEAGFGSTGK